MEKYNIRIARPCYFVFELPEQETEKLTIEVSVDYGEDLNDTKYVLANAWVRSVDLPVKMFVTTVRVMTGSGLNEDLPSDIVKALNRDDGFINGIINYLDTLSEINGTGILS